MKKKKIFLIFFIVLLVFLLSYLCYRIFIEITYINSNSIAINENVTNVSNMTNITNELMNNKKIDVSVNVNESKNENINIKESEKSTVRSDTDLELLKNKIKNYTALGDSITLGTGLKDISDESYPALVSKTLNISASNYGIDGMNSSWLLYNIEHGDYDDSIKNADLITLSVGSNDILWIFYQELADSFNVDINNCDNLIQSISNNFSKATISEKIDMIKKLYTNFYSEKTKNDLKTAINNYKKTWPKLIKTIKNINPKSEIIVIEYYNPYHNFLIPSFNMNLKNFNEYLDSYVDELNDFLYKNNDLGYDIAYIKDDFYSSNSTNVHISLFNLNLDPHPNKMGHQIIYEKIVSLLEEKNK